MWRRGLERRRSARCGERCEWKNCRRAGRNTSGSGCDTRRRSDLRFVARIGRIKKPEARNRKYRREYHPRQPRVRHSPPPAHGDPRGFTYSGAALMAVLYFAGMNAKQITPILNVSDISACFEWFKKWGWRKCWDWGTPPTFGAVGSLFFFFKQKTAYEISGNF